MYWPLASWQTFFQVLAFLPADEIPVIVLNRDDIDDDDESAKDSATGIIQRNGKWSFS